MTVITTTLYYDDDEPPSLLGRAVTKGEYDTISKNELRDAIRNCYDLVCLGIGDIYIDLGTTPAADREFNAMSVETVKEVLRQHNVLLLRSPQPLCRFDWPVFTKGPRKGERNWKRTPQEVCDRWYTLEEEDDVVAVEAKVFLHENGTFSVLEKAAA